ncbi:tRNA lysidine(34) synthetase TilS [Candidatus Saccharibacteria bacterium]|nr:tRNA lysidine(34) synthetase TilS [Candidatus Saccharibacteria bacterium]
MKKILAVSGGVDSMVMLDFFANNFPNDELVVATFDHGTRESSAEDALFVENISRNQYALKKVYRGKAELGAGVSEEMARKARYDFLREVAFREKGEIFTAHHLDDLVETVMINFLRGTEFRGLAGLSSLGIRRPFIDGFFEKTFDKREILNYAAEHEIVFREDPTNSSEDYLRNRIREKVLNLPIETKRAIFQLWQNQKRIVKEIDEIVENLLPEDLKFERDWFRNLDEKTALEILRAATIRAGVATTGPQRKEFLNAILNYQPGKQFNLPDDKLVKINKRDFVL